jgi:hypothetical protein
MPYYIAGRASTQNEALSHSERISAGNPRAAVRIARRLLAFARKHSAQGVRWDTWWVATSKSIEGKFLVIAQGRED